MGGTGAEPASFQVGVKPNSVFYYGQLSPNCLVRRPLVGDLDNEDRLQGDLEELFIKFKVGAGNRDQSQRENRNQ